MSKRKAPPDTAPEPAALDAPPDAPKLTAGSGLMEAGDYAARPDNELRKLALDIVEGKVFGSWECRRNEDAVASFIVLHFISQELAERMAKAGVVQFYEYYTEAMDRSVNGRPMFFSCHVITKPEWQKVVKLVDQLTVLRDQFVEGEKLNERLDARPDPAGPAAGPAAGPGLVEALPVPQD